ncbi:hypothetical protein BH23GEM4_BH23GEM4_21670 [soil metagenome]
MQIFPAGIPRTIAITLIGAAFAGLFVWLLALRIRRVLQGPERIRLELAMVALGVGLLILAFAGMYQKLGIIDTTQQGSPVVYDLLTSIYYSVVTFTTLGYGDFQPTPGARPIAALQAFTGYLILGVLASTAATLVHPTKGPLQVKED